MKSEQRDRSLHKKKHESTSFEKEAKNMRYARVFTLRKVYLPKVENLPDEYILHFFCLLYS